MISLEQLTVRHTDTITHWQYVSKVAWQFTQSFSQWVAFRESQIYFYDLWLCFPIVYNCRNVPDINMCAFYFSGQIITEKFKTTHLLIDWTGFLKNHDFVQL